MVVNSIYNQVVLIMYELVYIVLMYRIVGSPAFMTLVGQSTSTTGTIGLPYNRKNIIAVSGQNLSFASGEYMTIAFHSSGTTNIYYSSANIGTPTTDVAYTSITNYGTNSFPATLTSTSISASLSIRLCLELY